LILTAISLYLAYLTYRTTRDGGPQGIHIQVDEITIDQQTKHLPRLFARLEQQPPPSVFDRAPEILSKRNMQRRIKQATTTRQQGGGQHISLRFKGDYLIKTEEWVALHSHYVRSDGGYSLAREAYRPVD
jgi:hypothetical protein